MTPMDPAYFEEGLVDKVDKKEIMTDECIVRVRVRYQGILAEIQDINTYTATPRSLDFQAPFTLHPTSSSSTTVRAFLTHFDTFFSPRCGSASQVSPEDRVNIVPPGDDDDFERGVEPVSDGDDVEVSFTTGSRGKETHWKQVSFLLRQPIVLTPGTCHAQSILGTWHNDRVLDMHRPDVTRIASGRAVLLPQVGHQLA